MANPPINASAKKIVAKQPSGTVLILFGSDSMSHDPFEAAARYLCTKLKLAYQGTPVKVSDPKNVTSPGVLLKLLLQPRTTNADKIRELHIFAHSWPLGVSLNFGGEASEAEKKDLRDIYGLAVDDCIGHDEYKEMEFRQFRISNLMFLSKKQIHQLRAGFAPEAKARFWGCNTGKSNGREPYSSIAKTFAEYSGVITEGTPKGTAFYAFIENKWTTKHAAVGKKAPWPFELRSFQDPSRMQTNKYAPTLKESELQTGEDVYKTNYFDGKMDPLFATLNLGSSVYEFKASNPNHSQICVNFNYMRFASEIQVKLIKDGAGEAIAFTTLMKIEKHPDWKLSSDGKMLTVSVKSHKFVANFDYKNINTELIEKGTIFYFSISFKLPDGDDKTIPCTDGKFKIVK
jgi:hypothetical protein